MRVIIILIVIVGLLALGGWLVFDFSGNRASVEVRTDKIEQDTSRVLDKSKELLHQADKAVGN